MIRNNFILIVIKCNFSVLQLGVGMCMGVEQYLIESYFTLATREREIWPAILER